MRDAVIFDMDGTLCDVEPVRHYVTGPRRNFDAFHRASLFCYPNPVAMAIYRHPSTQSHDIVIVTARDARYEQVTRLWLARNQIDFDALYMRPWGDTRADAVVKEEILTQIRGDGFDPILAIDDRDDIIAVWQAAGIPTVKVS